VQPIPFADAFLVSSILTLLMPTLLLVSLVVWYMVAVKKVGRRGVRQAGPSAASGDADRAGSAPGSAPSATVEGAHGSSAAAGPPAEG